MMFTINIIFYNDSNVFEKIKKGFISVIQKASDPDFACNESKKTQYEFQSILSNPYLLQRKVSR